ncbi:hypothetical protein OIV83_001691 [Microbotryomycetes sp. JL201]|nr:hypothetical protein OIV83_001691 [Microbotryomycetes sp. JL201]
MSAQDPFSENGLALLGGYPIKSQDLAACIVFVAAYALVIPLVLRRLVSKRTRSPLLIRPTIFVALRIATYIIRAIQATSSGSSIGLYIADQVLLLSGFVLICEPLLALLKYHIRRNYNPEVQLQPKRDSLSIAVKVADIALLAALVLGATTGSQFSNLFNSQGGINQGTVDAIRRMRDANAALCIVATVGAIVIVVLASVRDHRLPRDATLFISVTGGLLTIVSVYKLAFYAHTPRPSPISRSMKAVFYVLGCLPELVATALFFVFDLERMFEIRQGRLNNKIEKLIGKSKPVPQHLLAEREAARRGRHEESQHPEPSLVEMHKY